MRQWRKMPMYMKKAFVAEMSGSSPYKKNTNIYEYYCDYVYEDRYTKKYFEELPYMTGNEIVYCHNCCCGCRFKNMEKHCNTIPHLRNRD